MYMGQGWNPYHDCISSSKLNLNNEFRKLWEEHTVWTRLTIESIVFGLPDLEPTTNRLLRNPDDFAMALKPFYGEAISSKFAVLLKEHLTLAAQLVQAAKVGNNRQAAEIEKKWYENADEIAALLGQINPYWSTEAWRMMLYEHLRLVKAEATDMLRKDYKAGVDIWDELENQALEMADMMSEGIIRQFPSLFLY